MDRASQQSPNYLPNGHITGDPASRNEGTRRTLPSCTPLTTTRQLQKDTLRMVDNRVPAAAPSSPVSHRRTRGGGVQPQLEPLARKLTLAEGERCTYTVSCLNIGMGTGATS